MKAIWTREMVTKLSLLQAKAALPDKASETFDLFLQHGHTADSYTLTALVDAYARANQPLKAQECFDTKTAEHGIPLTVVNWNTLLGAYAKGGHMVHPPSWSHIVLYS